MLLIEIVLSSITLVSIWAITNHHHSWGVPLAFVTQGFWVWMWIHTGQIGIILIDAGMLWIYGSHLYKRWASLSVYRRWKRNDRNTKRNLERDM